MSLSTQSKHKQPSGPLKIPAGRAPGKTRRIVTEKLRGHVTSEGWLPADSKWPGLADLRDEQLRHRDQVAVLMDDLYRLEARFEKEDADQAEALRQKYRDHSGDDVDDDRTSPEDRIALIGEAEGAALGRRRSLRRVRRPRAELHQGERAEVARPAARRACPGPGAA